MNMDFFNVTSVIEGIATGAIAVLIYMGRKSVEAQSMKRDLATMMIMEIQYNISILSVKSKSVFLSILSIFHKIFSANKCFLIIVVSKTYFDIFCRISS